MDIDYHYFVVKTLAHAAGFSAEDAQTIAYYSQQVDDFTKCLPMEVGQEPPAFFLERKYAVRLGETSWLVLPHPTGIDVVQSLEKHYRHTTLVSFHFVPARPLAELEAVPDFTRADYRCVRADDGRAVLINQIVDQAVEAVQEQKSEKSLMQLGMALHSYADTYAHCGYSGLDGWENHADIKKAYNQQTGKEEVSWEERIAYKILPHIGHGNAGHIPDICTYQIDVAMQKDEQDNALMQHIVRDNLQEFLGCAKAMLEHLCRAAQSDAYEKIVWDEFKEQLAAAMQVATGDENKTEKLIAHWSTVFPQITYTYDKDERFYSIVNLHHTAALAGNGRMAIHTMNVRDFHSNNAAEADIEGLRKKEAWEEIDEAEENTAANIIFYEVTDAFYMYNELAYRRAELVLGTAELLDKNAGLLENELTESVAVEENAYDGCWEPQSELGLAVYTAGFAYDPDKNIICSTMNNAQRMGGYCKGYDEAAIAINSVIDCEPIYFCYDGYEWMIELWKGQYGIETGCEVGIYYREQGKPLSIAEKTVLGKLYGCVPDERMLDIRFTLKKEGNELFERDWMRHWWLTGFRWGLLSEPEQLTMAVGLRFPNREMQQAFIHQGLEGMCYTYMETDERSVEFCFAKPVTPQPVVRDMMRKSAQEVNQELVKAYNSACTKYGITSNDPNVISRSINEQAGIAEKKLYEKLIYHYNNRLKLKDEVQNRTV